MKQTAFSVILISLSMLAHAGNETKIIQVDKTQFSKVYPAVWFSPSTGEMTSLTERSERPPEKKYEIWIEPSDPEFCYGPERNSAGVGFALIGKGPEAFANPSIPDDPKLSLKLTPLIEEGRAHEQFVFYCKGRTSSCLIMVTAMDSEEELILFQWRLVTEGEGVPRSRAGSDER